MAHHTDPAMQECIDRCRRCEDACLEAANHCLQKGGRHAAAHHIRTLMACARICGTSAHFMLIGSEFHSRTCDVCAEVCEACAIECERLGEDEMMQQCADICRRCAESCRQMAASHTRS
jgi:hypothetical protein